MKPEYIKRFEDLGLGMFVHFGLFSQMGEGEWYYTANPFAKKDYYFSGDFANKFNPKKDWAKKIVKLAKRNGVKYINITTRHHEGFCMYDSCGLTDWDVMHYGPKRDLMKEFVDACNEEGIIPFFYSALLDWHHPDYNNNFPNYIEYLLKNVEVLCKNYGKIGGFWFDGWWDKPNEDWQFDRLYKLIRKYQPEAMIINNTGMSRVGEVSHYEIDSVTFERGVPSLITYKDGKERSGEMCEVFAQHWGYAKRDIDYKPISQIISSLVDCRYCNCNLLLNVGPMGNGDIRPLDKAYYNAIGDWIKANKNFIYKARRAVDIEAENAEVLYDGKYYYAVVKHVPMCADPNVQKLQESLTVTIKNHKMKNPIYLDNKEKVEFDKKTNSFVAKPFYYGTAYAVRVIRFK